VSEPGAAERGGEAPGTAPSATAPSTAGLGRILEGRLAHPLWQLTLARWRAFFREPSAIFWTFGFPMILAFALGVAFRSRPPDRLPVAMVVGDGASGAPPGSSPAERALLAHPGLQVTLLAPAAAEAALRRGRVALVVRPGTPPAVDYITDPTRPDSRLARLIVDEALQKAAGRTDAISARDVAVTARGSRYIDFLIPGLLGLSLLQSGLWGIGFILVEFRTRKLIKLMVATPMRRSHFLLAFVALRAAFLLLELPVLLGFARLAFDVQVQGSVVLVFALAVLGALSFSGMGLLLASRAENTQTVAGLINVVSLPMFIGSGVFFSSERFPEELQPTLQALPLTALNEALRAVINEAAGPLDVLRPVLIVTAWGLVSFLLALKLFKWR
jgi:ABC-type multidrug transport system permease subunit